jgi:glycerol uptake facilitator-like aquaporin
MFSLPLIQSSLHAPTGMAQWLAEFVATFGLLLVVLGHRRSGGASRGPLAVRERKTRPRC